MVVAAAPVVMVHQERTVAMGRIVAVMVPPAAEVEMAAVVPRLEVGLPMRFGGSVTPQ